MLVIDKTDCLSFDLVIDAMRVDPSCEQLVPALHPLEAMDHLSTDLFDSLLDHVFAPENHEAVLLALLKNLLGLM